MKNIRHGIIVLLLLLCSLTPVAAEVSIGIGIGLPNVSIGINLPLFPQLVPVPGYPVYYAPQLNANYFFYDGLYWVYQDDNWYASSWYNGPWWIVEPYDVPLFILRVPVRYYRQPPMYFRGWRANAPPRWGEHWGREWEQHRRGWDHWNRGTVPAPAPLPRYQRQYSGDRYPRVEQQQELRRQNYRYQPRDTVVRQHYQQHVDQGAPAPAPRGRRAEPQMRAPRPQEAPHAQPPRRGGEEYQRPAPQPPPQQRGPAFREERQPVPREQQAPRMQRQEQRVPERGGSQEPQRGRGQGQGRDEERGR